MAVTKIATVLFEGKSKRVAPQPAGGFLFCCLAGAALVTAVTLVLTTACSGTSVESIVATKIAEIPTATPAPTVTPVPTATPVPTVTPVPYLPDVIEQVESSVVVIQSTDGTSLGSGFVTATAGDGDILIYTNEHVVDGKETVHIRNHAMRNAGDPDLLGTVVWKDKDKDLALVQACCLEDAEALEIRSESLAKGMPVVALGYPLGNDIQPTASVGVVSGFWLNHPPGYTDYEFPVIQMDIAVNPGNSGGPLLAFDGKLVGMVMAKAEHVAVEGYAFAIQSWVLMEALRELSGDYAPTK